MRRILVLVPLLFAVVPACVCGQTKKDGPDPRESPRARPTGVVTLNSVYPELTIPEGWEPPKLGIEAGAKKK